MQMERRQREERRGVGTGSLVGQSQRTVFSEWSFPGGEIRIKDLERVEALRQEGGRSTTTVRPGNYQKASPLLLWAPFTGKRVKR